ncbi:MAG: citrate synthase [Cyanobacteria bacterium]|nr:citrate synthase [Cyanobacteriota bacterium]
MTTSQASKESYSPGLEGIVAGVTQLSFVNPALNSLMYRGYDIRDLAEHACYEEVAFLLIYGHLPNQKELDTFNTDLRTARKLSPEFINTLKSFPKNANMMDTLRAAVALLSLSDPDVKNDSHEANVRKATRLTGQFASIVAANYRISQGKDPVAPDATLGHAENFLYMLFDEKPDAYLARIFDMTLIAYTDHGFNASTFAARVTTSTLSDLHSGIVSAIGTLKGSLHGGANEEAMKMLLEIGSPDKAEAWVIDALATKKKIMGFGHREYKTGDPRAFLLNDYAKELSERVGQPQWHQTATIVAQTMEREKNILPNVDFPTAYIYYLMKLPIDIYTPIFALARVAGWSSHIIEQLDANRLIRPKAIYEGPDHLSYVPLNQR